MHRVRTSVRENRLVSAVISEADYVEHIEQRGRGWVIEVAGELVAFAVADVRNGSIWALFVDPRFEGRGCGRQLLDSSVAWLWEQGLESLWLTTAPDTRAQRFYEAAGWRVAARTASGEVRLELHRSRAMTSRSQEMG